MGESLCEVDTYGGGSPSMGEMGAKNKLG